MQNITDALKQRTKELKALGFKDYEAYTRSALWKAIRAEVFRKRGKQCCCCDAKATQVHHQQYDRKTLRGQCIAHLYPICEHCHSMTHRPGWMHAFTVRLRRDFSRNTIGFNKIVLDDYIRLTPKKAKPRRKTKKQDYNARFDELEKKVNQLFSIIEELQVDNEMMAEKLAAIESHEPAF